MPFQLWRGTRAALDALAASNSLIPGRPGLITDEGRGFICLTVSTYQAFAKQGEGGNAPVTQIEVNLGTPRRSGGFTIAGSGLVTGRPVAIALARGPFTGKGALSGEEALYPGFLASGQVISPTQISVNWACPSRIGGVIKFNYQIGG